ncbi:MAG: PEP-CTERM sorting domain-containing protein [Nitrospirota bacterium]
MKRRLLLVFISIVLVAASMAEVNAAVQYQWEQMFVWSMSDNGVVNLPITSSGSIFVSEPYRWQPWPEGDPDWYSWAADVYRFQFSFTDAVGDVYSWDIAGPRFLDLEFYVIDGFGLDFHLGLPDPNDVYLGVSAPEHDGYSHVGDCGIPNVERPYVYPYGINFQGTWERVPDTVPVPEPATLLLVGAGGAWFLLMRRSSGQCRPSA